LFSARAAFTVRHPDEGARRLLDPAVLAAAEDGERLSALDYLWVAKEYDNLKALDVKLTPEDLAHIDRISPPGRVIVPFYQAAFGPAEHRW
jgi:hypothetical protein